MTTNRRATVALLCGLCFCLSPFRIHAQPGIPPTADTTRPAVPYDPFGPENSPDHTGQGSGGVVTPSPTEALTQTFFTRINADYYGVQYMLDSPLQIALGSGWSAYQENDFGFLMKIRLSGFRERMYDPLRDENIPYYLLSSEASFEYPFRENHFRSYKVRVHAVTETKGLSMPGIGVLVSNWNLLVAGDRLMGRKLQAEATWIEVAGGYVMPLSPNRGGVNIAVCGSVELFGVKYQTYYSDPGQFVGIRIGSIGWLASVGWNVGDVMNLAGYVGAEWGFSTGGLGLPTDKIVFADIARTNINLGLQATGRWINVVGGIQKEWEYIDFQGIEDADRALRYYLGVSVYLQR